MSLAAVEIHLVYGVKGGIFQPMYHRYIHCAENKWQEKILTSPRNNVRNKTYVVKTIPYYDLNKKLAPLMDQLIALKPDGILPKQDIMIDVKVDGRRWKTKLHGAGCVAPKVAANEKVNKLIDELVSLVESEIEKSKGNQVTGVESVDIPFDESNLVEWQ